MKLKYYLRGVGIGIVVTAIILSVTKKPEKLTDAQIKLRALELGMVEESVLADLDNKADTVKDEETTDEIKKDTTDNEKTQIEEENSEESKESEEAEETQPEKIENYIVITVESGNDSMVISQKLFEAGLVNSAAEYNRFLVENGYDRRLRTGNHEIPANATNEEMAKILCGIL